MKTIATIIGARPQFIKAAIVSRQLRLQPEIREFLIHTGQHYDDNMSDLFFRELDIPLPDRNLAIGSGSHGEQTGRMMIALEDIFAVNRPEWVLVYGDTNSTLAGALVAAKLRIPIMHVEAGLRSYNRAMPEEINRILTDRISDALMVPSKSARGNLLREGCNPDSIHDVGDVMYDAALHFAEYSQHRWFPLANQYGLCESHYALVTVHRAENTNELGRLGLIFDALVRMAKWTKVVLPLHPRTKARAGVELIERLKGAGVLITEPVGYLEMIQLQRHAAIIVTDSGGVQKEAFFYRVPCVTLRSETEWTETVTMGWNRLCEIDSAVKIEAACLDAVGRQGMTGTPYGVGNAAQQIANFLANA